MANYDLDEVVETVPPVESETEKTGQGEVTTESKENEVPEETGETSKEKVEEVKTDDKKDVAEDGKAVDEKTTEKKPLTKKASDQFTTDSQAVKAAENLAIALREDVNFKKMTIEQTRVWYDENRPRLGNEGFKGDRAKAKELNKTINEEDKLTRLESKLDNFMEAQQPKKKTEPEVKTPTAPIEPEFDEERYGELLLEDPKEAAKMFREYRTAQSKYAKQLVEFEGSRLGQEIKPFLEKVADGYQKMTKKEQEAEQEATNQKEWKEAEATVQKFIKEQGEGAFKYSYDECKELMNKLATEDYAVYKGIVEADGKERAIFKLYQNALKEKEDAEKESRLAQLEQEIATLKNSEAIDQINAVKGVARITQTNGGVTPKTPQKPLTPQEIFEDEMRGNSQTRGKYDLEI